MEKEKQEMKKKRESDEKQTTTTTTMGRQRTDVQEDNGPLDKAGRRLRQLPRELWDVVQVRATVPPHYQLSASLSCSPLPRLPPCRRKTGVLTSAGMARYGMEQNPGRGRSTDNVTPAKVKFAGTGITRAQLLIRDPQGFAPLIRTVQQPSARRYMIDERANGPTT